MALISGAAHALEYKKLNPRATDEEIIQYVNNKSDEIAKKLDTEE